MSKGVGLDFLKSPAYSTFIFKSQTGQHPYNAVRARSSLPGQYAFAHTSLLCGMCWVSSGGLWKVGIYEAQHLTPYR